MPPDGSMITEEGGMPPSKGVVLPSEGGMPPSKSDILPSGGVITPMWAVSCAKYGIQGAGALDDIFGGAFGAQEGASETDREARAQCAPPPSGCAPDSLHSSTHLYLRLMG